MAIKLSKRELKVIGWMTDIADAQPMNEDETAGEGDYQSWTLADFKAADTANDKLTTADLVNASLLKSLEECVSSLHMCYDSSEDNRNDPLMQNIGKAMHNGAKAIRSASINETND
jgi:hypothetical protein